jgi:hypothetical protein
VRRTGRSEDIAARALAFGAAKGFVAFWLLLVGSIAAVLLANPSLITPFSGSSTLH